MQTLISENIITKEIEHFLNPTGYLFSQRNKKTSITTISND